jgi:aarF domain-containing kinase
MMSVDDRESTKLVLKVVAVAENNGLKLPREFGLLLKQVPPLIVLCTATI